MTTPISISIPHQLGVTEARKRIEGGFAKLETEISGGLAKMEKRWEGDTLHFSARAMGQSISGRLEVLERAIAMEVDLPAFLGALANTIKGRVRTQGRLMLEKK